MSTQPTPDYFRGKIPGGAGGTHAFTEDAQRVGMNASLRKAICGQHVVPMRDADGRPVPFSGPSGCGTCRSRVRGIQPATTAAKAIAAYDRRMAPKADPQSIVDEHIRRASAGLDFADADDRAIFRTRMDEGMRMTKVTFIETMADVIGAPKRVTRSAQVRAIADHHIATTSRP